MSNNIYNSDANNIFKQGFQLEIKLSIMNDIELLFIIDSAK